MKITDNSLAAVLVLSLAGSAAAAPKAAQTQPTAPAKKTAGAQSAPAAPAAKPTPLQQSLKSAVEAMVKEVSADNEGEYPLNDSMTDDSWNTKLKGFDWAAMRDVEAGEKIVRAEFSGSGRSFVVDFTLRLENRRWEIIDETVMSVDGVDRFVYNAKNERVPVKRTVDAEESMETPQPEDEFPVSEEDEEADFASDDTEGI